MKDNESLLERGQKDKVKMDEKRIQQLVRGFAANWKKSIEELNEDVMQSFTNFKNGTAILQVRERWKEEKLFKISKFGDIEVHVRFTFFIGMCARACMRSVG